MSAPAAHGLATEALDDDARARRTMRRVSARLLPFLFVLYVVNFVDRTNVGMAALQMNRDLRFSATAYGIGAGIFYVGYVLCEVPSNLVLARVGARRWIARIMITWGLVAAATMFVRTPAQFYAARLALGAAEAGFFPGVVYYLAAWFPAADRARALSRFMIATPLSASIGNALGGWLLGLDGRFGLRGWHWLFLVEGLPAVLLGVAVLVWLTERPADARWLTGAEKAWLAERVRRDQDGRAPHLAHTLRGAMVHPTVWLLAVSWALVVVALTACHFWMPIVVRDALGTSDAATGLVTAAIGGVTALAMLVVGASSDRRQERVWHMAACVGVAAFGFAGAALLPNAVARVLALASGLVAAQSFMVPLWCVPDTLLRGSGAAAGIALVNSVGSAGGLLGPYLVGRVRDATGDARAAFLLFAAVLGAAAMLTLRLRERRAPLPSATRAPAAPWP